MTMAESNNDRGVICKIISEMLDNPDKSGVYPTSTCYTRLEHYIKQVRMEAVGWCHAEMCINLDSNKDPRTTDVSFLIERAKADLER